MLSRIGNIATKVGARSMRVQIAQPLVRTMSGLEGREKAEEKRYFAQLEAERVAAAKAKFEAILASEDEEAKEELICSLGAY